jgi:tripartite ATP-independent transporter DctP family solute receptor
MKKVLLPLVLLLGGLFLIVPFASAKMTIKVGHVDRGNRLESDMEAFASVFKDLVESQSGGEMEVAIYPAGQLGGAREMVESVQLGAIQIVPCYTAVASIFSPKAELPYAPFIFNSVLEAWRVLDGPFGKELADVIYKESKLRVLAYGDANGFRDFYFTKKAVRSPADMKGLKIRSPESKMMFNMLTAFGANPVVIPWTQLYMSMQTDVLDGFEVQPAGVVDQKIHETFKQAILTNHSYDTLYIFANDNWYKKLTPRQREIVLNAARVGAVVSRGVSENSDLIALKIMKAKGIQIYYPKPQEIAEFIKLGQPAALNSLEKTTGKEWVQKLLRARDEARKELAVK